MADPRGNLVKTTAPIKKDAIAVKTTAPIKPKLAYKPAPTANNESSFSDAAYAAQLAALQKAASNYQATMGLQRDRLGQDYTEAASDLGVQRGRDLTNIKEDYAARGVVRSGLYGKRNDEYESTYNNQLADLARAKDRGNQDLDVGYVNFQDEMGLNKNSAIDAAIQRRLQEIKSGKYTTTPPKPKTATLSSAPTNSIAGYSV